MAEISPLSTELPELQEGASVNQTFTFIAGEGETLKSINITSYEPVEGITVSGNNYQGSYQSVFTFGGDALKYRIGDELKSASSWEDLPPPTEANLYLWRAPSSLQRTFSYTVTVLYSYQEESSSGGSGSSGGTTPPPVERTLTKTYTQLIYGDWSRWANMLRTYVYAGD